MVWKMWPVQEVIFRMRTIIAFFLAFSINAYAGTWVDNETWSNRSYSAGDSYIAKQLQEARFTGLYPLTNETYWATGLAFIIPDAFLHVLEGVERKLARSGGIEVSVKQDDVSLVAAWEYNPARRSGWVESEIAEWRQKLSAMKINTEQLRAARLTTKPYNRLANREAYSQAKFLVFDGETLFGVPCTLVVTYRTDHAKQWGFRNMHDLFSFGYEMRLIDTVTDTEFKMLSGIGFNNKPELLPDISIWYTDSELWRALKQKCQTSDAEATRKR